MKIILDGFGGDNAPDEIILGAYDAIAEKKDLDIVIVGKEDTIHKFIKENNLPSTDRISVINATEVVENEDNPIEAVKHKKDSSLIKGLTLVSEGVGNAFVSAGNTGAVFTAATLIIKRIKGIKRSALAPLVPTLNGNSILIDAGANAECKSEYYPQFALMGSVYSKEILGVSNPKVALINIGVEHHKGTSSVKEAYKLMENYKNINFMGNIEARDVLLGAVDVYVCDGWTGNMVIKSIEGTLSAIFKLLKGIFKTNALTLLAACILKPHLKSMIKKFNAKESGGALILGLKAPVVKAHGNSDRLSIKSAILFADKCASQNICLTIEKLISEELCNTFE